MEGRVKNNMKEVGLAFIMGFLVILGVIGGAGSLNWGIKGEGSILHIVAGVIAIIDAAITGVAFYRKFLKPSIS